MRSDRKFKFTEAKVKSLPASSKGRDHYYDELVPDLELRVTQRGAKSFNAYLWSSALGRPIRAFLGKWPSLSVDEARKLAQVRIAEIVQGKDPSRQKRIAREDVTVGDAVQAYLASIKLAERKGTTLQFYTYLAERFLKDLYTRKLRSISAEHVLALRLRARDQDGSRAERNPRSRPQKRNRTVTANRVVQLLSQAINHALRNGWDGKNPCELVRPFPEKSSSVRLEDGEIGSFIAACEQLAVSGDQVGDYLLICLFTGVRRRNVAAMRWDQIDRDRGVWDVPETKNGLPIRVYLSPDAMRVIERRREVRTFSPFVFPSNGRGGHLNDPRKGLERVLSAAGLQKPELTIHALKHTFISCAYGAGINPVVVSRLGGHKIRGVTGLYGHASEQQVRAAYAAVASFMRHLPVDSGSQPPGTVKACG